MTVDLRHGDCLDVLRGLPDNSVDSVCTDPPYGLANTTTRQIIETLTRWLAGDREYIPEGKGFMGKSWDAFVPPVAVWDECLRVLKPGGYLLSFGGTRTFDLIYLGARLAGFDMRDSVAWIHGQGFPKGKDQLKPAFEPVVVARKPLVGTVAQNVLAYGTGAINVDAGRIESDEDTSRKRAVVADTPTAFGKGLAMGGNGHSAGRWPANVALDSDSAAALDQMSGGTSYNPGGRYGTAKESARGDIYGNGAGMPREGQAVFGYGDRGGASRFFLTAEPDAPDLPIDELAERFMYCAKAPKSERPSYVKEGGGFWNQNYGGYKTRTCDTCQTRFAATGPQTCGHDGWSWQEQLDRKPDTVSHPTVKPLALMRWLVRLVTPPGGTVLEPFAGSGATVEAAILEGFNIIAIEREADYLPLIQARIFRAQAVMQAAADNPEPEQLDLFADEESA